MLTAKAIINRIIEFQQEIRDTDLRLRRYLSDRRENPHPRQEELIQQIRNFEPQVDRFLRANRNSEIEMRLDSLLHSLMVNERIWNRQFEEASHVDPTIKGEAPAPAADTTPAPQTRPLPPAARKLFGKLYEISSRQWDRQGIDARESKQDLARRLIPEYKQIRPLLGKGKKLSVVYDRRTQRIHLKATDPNPS